MPKNPRSTAADLRAAARLLVDATTATSGVVEEMHHTIAGGPLGWPERAVSGLVYAHIRRVTRVVGYSPVNTRYNSGQHVSVNGRLLAAELERLTSTWPVEVEEIAILAFSMGGLVARSACHVAEQAGHRWRQRLASMVFLGTPH